MKLVRGTMKGCQLLDLAEQRRTDHPTPMKVEQVRLCPAGASTLLPHNAPGLVTYQARL